MRYPSRHAFINAAHTCELQGRVLLSKLTADEDWTRVYAVSRRPLHFEHERLQHIALDLKNKNKVTESLKSEKVSGVTHVFHTAFAGDMTNTDRGVAQMLDHLIDGLEANGESLQHVYFTTGLKCYGMHFGAVKAPYLETDDRHMPPNYDFDLEDTVERRVKNGARYPGSPEAYDGVFCCAVDNGLLMDGAIYTSTNPKAANHHFNICNGDPSRWSQVWPKTAEWFGCKTSEPLAMPLEKLMADKEPLWKDIQTKYGLKDYKMDDLVQWSFADITWKTDYDFACSTSKLRQAGFEGQKLENLGMFIETCRSLQSRKSFPRIARQARRLLAVFCHTQGMKYKFRLANAVLDGACTCRGCVSYKLVTTCYKDMQRRVNRQEQEFTPHLHECF